MLLKETLRDVMISQRDALASFDQGIVREKKEEIDLTLPFASVISGIRRCGKSTLLCQLMGRGKSHYFNFEDPRVASFEVGDFQKLDDIFSEEGEGRYFFDEIQNVQRWELFVRALLDKKKMVVLTGSNASLLSKELGTRLTGRHVRYELFPFSFKEALLLTGQHPSVRTFEDYLFNGGFPEYLKQRKKEILQTLLNDILARDIVVRHKLRSAKTIRELATYLLTNIGNAFSYSRLRKTFDISTNSAIAFVSYFEDSYLLCTVNKFDYSLKKQAANPKKVYAIDTGLAVANAFSFSSDVGRLLENAVFLHLRRDSADIFYFKEQRECDFVVRDGRKVCLAVQVCHTLTEDNKERELEGLMEALDAFALREGLVLTYDQEDEFVVRGKKITVKPVWKWLLAR